MLEVSLSASSELSPTTSADDDAFRLRYTTTVEAPVSAADSLKLDDTYRKALAVHRAAVEYVHVSDAIADFPEATRAHAGQALFNLGQDVVISHRAIDVKCSYLAFLYDEYEPRIWYFECVECVRRICLTGFMLLYDDESIGKIYTAALLSLSFTVIYAYASPYVDDSTDRFSTAMSAMIFLQLFLTIMLYAETHIDDQDIRAGWSPGRFGAFMTVLALAAGPLEAFAEFCFEAETDPVSLLVALLAAVGCALTASRRAPPHDDVEPGADRLPHREGPKRLGGATDRSARPPEDLEVRFRDLDVEPPPGQSRNHRHHKRHHHQQQHHHHHHHHHHGAPAEDVPPPDTTSDTIEHLRLLVCGPSGSSNDAEAGTRL